MFSIVSCSVNPNVPGHVMSLWQLEKVGPVARSSGSGLFPPNAP